MSRFIFTRLAQLVVLSAGLFVTKTYAGLPMCSGQFCNTMSGLTCCSNGYFCCPYGGGYCSVSGNCCDDSGNCM